MHNVSSATARQTTGFSLIELIVVMVVVGILAGIVAVFIRSPMEGYMATSRRAELTDTADGALLRIARDVRTALPNSLRMTQVGTAIYLEYLPSEGGGRYREQRDSTADCTDPATAGCDILDFTLADTKFDVLGSPVDITGAHYLVIYNLGLPDADVWAGDNYSPLEAANSSCTVSGCSTLAFSSFQFPLESPSHRFYIASKPVSYVCAPNTDGTGTLTRYANYSDHPTTDQLTIELSSGDLLANHVATCSFTYEPGASQRVGQLTLRIQLSQDGETVTLYREVVVNNDA